jgi:hypothetical protein
MVLSKEDLETWENDPESWCADEESDYWEYRLRVCYYLPSITILIFVSSHALKSFAWTY